MSNHDAALDVLAAWQRRTLCQYLLQRSDELFTLDELLTHLLTEARNAPDDVGPETVRRDEVAHRLHHVHLPKLADIDVVQYDEKAKLVRHGPRLSAVQSLLETFDDGGVTQELRL